jgi:hypothetical protein
LNSSRTTGTAATGGGGAEDEVAIVAKPKMKRARSDTGTTASTISPSAAATASHQNNINHNNNSELPDGASLASSERKSQRATHIGNNTSPDTSSTIGDTETDTAKGLAVANRLLNDEQLNASDAASSNGGEEGMPPSSSNEGFSSSSSSSPTAIDDEVEARELNRLTTALTSMVPLFRQCTSSLSRYKSHRDERHRQRLHDLAANGGIGHESPQEVRALHNELRELRRQIDMVGHMTS